MSKKQETVREFYKLYDDNVVIEFLPNSHRYNLVKDKKDLTKKISLAGASTIVGKLDKSGPLMKWAVDLTIDDLQESLKNNFLPTNEILEKSRNLYIRKRDKTADRGTAVHRFLYEYGIDEDVVKAWNRMLHFIKDEFGQDFNSETKKQIKKAVTGFLEWCEKNKPEFIFREKVVFSRKYKYVGTFDVLMKIKNKTYLIDYKTSKKIYSSHIYQSAGYFIALTEEMPELEIHGTGVISVSAEDKIDSKTGEITQKAGTVNVVFREDQDLKNDIKAFKALLNIYNIDKAVNSELYKLQK